MKRSYLNFSGLVGPDAAHSLVNCGEEVPAAIGRWYELDSGSRNRNIGPDVKAGTT